MTPYEIDILSLDISSYPEVLAKLENIIFEYKLLRDEIEYKINIIKAEKIVALDSERDTIGNRVVRKYSSQEVRDAKLTTMLAEDTKYMSMNTELNYVSCQIHTWKTLYEQLRRQRHILLSEYQQHGVRTYAAILNGNN